MQLTYAKVKNPAHEGMQLPSTFDTYTIFRNGKPCGEIKHLYRPKNSGGSAWCALVENQNGMKTSFWGKDVSKLLPEVRSHFEKLQAEAQEEQRNPSPWYTERGRELLLRFL